MPDVFSKTKRSEVMSRIRGRGDMEGECDLQWEPVYGPYAYIAEHAENPTEPWTQFTSARNPARHALDLIRRDVFFPLACRWAAWPGPME